MSAQIRVLSQPQTRPKTELTHGLMT